MVLSWSKRRYEEHGSMYPHFSSLLSMKICFLQLSLILFLALRSLITNGLQFLLWIGQKRKRWLEYRNLKDIICDVPKTYVHNKCQQILRQFSIMEFSIFFVFCMCNNLTILKHLSSFQPRRFSRGIVDCQILTDQIH